MSRCAAPNPHFVMAFRLTGSCMMGAACTCSSVHGRQTLAAQIPPRRQGKTAGAGRIPRCLFEPRTPKGGRRPQSGARRRRSRSERPRAKSPALHQSTHDMGAPPAHPERRELWVRATPGEDRKFTIHSQWLAARKGHRVIVLMHAGRGGGPLQPEQPRGHQLQPNRSNRAVASGHQIARGSPARFAVRGFSTFSLCGESSWTAWRPPRRKTPLDLAAMSPARSCWA